MWKIIASNALTKFWQKRFDFDDNLILQKNISKLHLQTQNLAEKFSSAFKVWNNLNCWRIFKSFSLFFLLAFVYEIWVMRVPWQMSLNTCQWGKNLIVHRFDPLYNQVIIFNWGFMSKEQEKVLDLSQLYFCIAIVQLFIWKHNVDSKHLFDSGNAVLVEAFTHTPTLKIWI